MWVPYLGTKEPLEEGIATHSSILAWRIPQTEKPGGLQLQKSQTQLKQLSMHRGTLTTIFTVSAPSSVY